MKLNTSKSRVLPGQVITMALMATLWMPPANATEDDFGIWTVISATDVFPSESGDGRWSYWVDAQSRYFDIGSGANQYVVRPAVGYRIGPNIQAWVGYARLQTRNGAGRRSDENRIWQQLNWTAGRVKGGVVTMRAKLLQRTVNTGSDTGVVFRFLTKYTRPISDDGSRSLILSVEPFFDLRDTDWEGQSGIAQNRTAIGVSWRIKEDLTLETSYVNQFIWRNRSENISNHLAVLNFKIKF